MKKFIKDKGLFIGLWLVIILIFAFGGMYSRYVSSLVQPDEIENEQRYYGKVDLISLEYNFDSETFLEKPYIATFTYEQEEFVTYVDLTFCYVEMISGIEPERMVLAAVKHHSEQEEIISNIAYLISYEESTKTLVMGAVGFVTATPIQVEFTLNDSLDGIVSYTVTSFENYNNEYNTAYDGAAAPAVENQMIEQYMTGTYPVDTVAGASEGTGAGMQELFALLNLFLDSLEGGN
ncbi:hypothetical protein RJI07_02760 [Mycoplasmatota bacterium WC30]